MRFEVTLVVNSLQDYLHGRNLFRYHDWFSLVGFYGISTIVGYLEDDNLFIFIVGYLEDDNDNIY